MAPPSPFTTPLTTLTPSISRQVLGPRVPTSLRILRNTKASIARPTTTPALVTATTPIQAQVRSLASEASKHGDLGTDKSHLTARPPASKRVNVQTSASAHGNADRATPQGSTETAQGGARSQAATQRDETGAGDAAAKEHPEAPRPILGMGDERGGKGR